MTFSDPGGTLRLGHMPSSVRLVPLAVALLLAVYMLRPQYFWPELEAFRLVMLAGGLAVVALVLDVLRGERFAATQVSLWFVVALAAWALAGTPWAADLALARVHALALVKIAVLYGLLRHAMRLRRDVEVVIGTVVACASILAVIGIYQYLFATFQGSRPHILSGANANVNDWAIVLAAVLPFAVAFSSSERDKRLRGAAAVAGIVLLAGIAASQSKGASLAVICALAPFAWRRRLYGALWLAAAAGLHALLPAVAEMTSPMTVRQRPVYYVDREAHVDNSTPGVAHRIELIADFKEKSYTSRLAIWRVGLELVRQHPVVGVGAGCFITAYAKAVDASYPADLRARSAHNTFLQSAAELGLPGAALFLGVLAGPLFVWRRAGPRGKWDGDGLLLASVSSLLVQVWGCCYLDHMENWSLYVAVATVEAVVLLPRSAHETPRTSAERSHDDALPPV